MRAFDRDLIRGGHYGQRSCEPHQQAEHMAAPTNAAFVKKVLANSEPSTHGPSRKWRDVRHKSEMRAKADIGRADGFCCARLLRNWFSQRGRCGNQVTIAWFRIGLGDKSDPQFGQSTVLTGLDLAGVGPGLQVRT